MIYMSTEPQQLEVLGNINFPLIVTGASESSNAYIISQLLGILNAFASLSNMLFWIIQHMLANTLSHILILTPKRSPAKMPRISSQKHAKEDLTTIK